MDLPQKLGMLHLYLVGGFNHVEKYESQWLVDYLIYYGQ
jgi:hypothetical protein